MRKYMVVYVPRTDVFRSTLNTAHVLDYEIDQYDLASNKRFNDLKAANRYARKLANEHGLILHKEVPAILDEDDDE